jgi:hypothetical protein
MGLGPDSSSHAYAKGGAWPHLARAVPRLKPRSWCLQEQTAGGTGGLLFVPRGLLLAGFRPVGGCSLRCDRRSEFLPLVFPSQVFDPPWGRLVRGTGEVGTPHPDRGDHHQK